MSNDNVAVKLQDGVTYVDGYGTRHKIMGTCKDHPDWCWSLQGSWFVRETGRELRYNMSTGEYYVSDKFTWTDLHKVAS